MDAAMTALDAFRAAVMADPAIQQRLCEQQDPANFAAIALPWAAERGIALTDDDLHVRPDPLGLHLLAAPAEIRDSWPPLPWLPARFAPESGGVDWLHFAGAPLREPFYADSLRRVRSRPFNKLVRYHTPFDILLQPPADSLKPSGFIFHMSRSGSTLVAQMLAASPANITVSEAEPLDAILQLPLFANIPPETHIAAVRAMVAASSPR
jgi:hypothetical protein